MSDPNDVLDPAVDPHFYQRERAAHLRERYGSDSEPWDKNFGGLDLGAAQARKASKELRDAIAAAGSDPERPLRFTVRIAQRDVVIQLRQQDDGQWTCHMPCEIEPGVNEHRTLLAASYDGLIGLVNKILSQGPIIRDLTEAESLELARACVTRKKEDLAAVLEAYLRLRIGRVVDDLTLSDPRYLPVINESCLFVFFHSEPSARDSKEFRDFLKSYAQARPYSLPLVKSAWKAFEEKAKDQAEQLAAVPQVSEEDLASMSDRDIEKTLTAVAREHADTERRRRDALRYDSRQEYRTAEQVIKDLHGIED